MVTQDAQAAQAGPTVHPTESELERFLRGELTRSETRAVVRHLLAGCEICRAVTRRVTGLPAAGPEGE